MPSGPSRSPMTADAEKTGAFAWYESLSPQGRRAFKGAFGGYAPDSYDPQGPVVVGGTQPTTTVIPQTSPEHFAARRGTDTAPSRRSSASVLIPVRPDERRARREFCGRPLRAAANPLSLTRVVVRSAARPAVRSATHPGAGRNTRGFLPC